MAGSGDKRYKIELWKKGTGETILEKFNETTVNQNITDTNGVVDDNRIRSALAAIKPEPENEEEPENITPPIDGGSLKKKSQNNRGKRKSKKQSTRNNKSGVLKRSGVSRRQSRR